MIYKSRTLNKKIVEHRRRTRGVYATEAGQEELFNLLHDMGLFRVVTKKELDARNRAILKLEELGFLDEEVVRAVIANLLTSGMLDSFEARKIEGSSNDTQTNF